MERTKIFVSYSHKDEPWKDRVMVHLGILEAEGLLHVWTDRRIEIGESWLAEIESAIVESRVALLLVTPNFLTSRFILETEVPRLLRLHSERGMLLLPLIVRPCAWQLVRWLAPRQVHPRDGRPLAAGTEVEIDADLAALAYELAVLIRRIEGETATEALALADRLTALGDRRSVRAALADAGEVGRFHVSSIDHAYRALEERFRSLHDSGAPAGPAVTALLSEAIGFGAPIYDAGSPLGCAFLYLHAASFALGLLRNPRGDKDRRTLEAMKERLSKAMVPMDALTHENAAQAAWQMRHAFDAILEKRLAV